MGLIRVITGGMRSGKSSFGERIINELKGEVLYIATGVITDKEMEERVRQHQARRGARYKTCEAYQQIDRIIQTREEPIVMIECVGTMVTNLMFDKYHEFDNLSTDEVTQLEAYVVKEVNKIINVMKATEKDYIIITNEVGSALVSEYKLGRVYTDILGRINQILGQIGDEVYLVVCGIPMKVKG